MPNKIQELTDKLYNEGLSKGKQEAEEMKEAAKKEAAAIIAEARVDAEKIAAEARKQAAELRTNTENDLKMASVQTIAAIKQQIENVLTATATAPVKGAMSDDAFVKDLLMTIGKAFNPGNSEPVSLEVIIPAQKKEALASFVEGEFAKAMKAGVEVSFSKHFQNGFKISPKGEGYTISFTEEDFKNILADYLRPGTKKLLFG